MDINKDMDHLHGLMELDILDSFIKTLFTVKVFINGLMVQNMMVNGTVAKCLVKVLRLGEMAQNLLMYMIIA